MGLANINRHAFMRNFLVLAALLTIGMPYTMATYAHACGQDSDCTVGDDRHYRIKLPGGYDGKASLGAIVFAHGYRGSAAGVMRNKSLLALADELGVAIVAAKSFSDDWRIPGVPRNTGTDGRLEFDYFEALVEDLKTRHAIDTDRLLMTGFSAGGMMVWNLACHRSELFAGYAPISGTFWMPEPETCDSPPASILHVHGDSDPVVPLSGRKIADTHQGDVFTVLEMYARYAGFTDKQVLTRDDWQCETRKNAGGQFLDFCLFEGGHSFKTSYVRRAWLHFEKAGLLQ